MEVNSKTVAAQIFKKLDSVDEKTGNNRIEKDAWNFFVQNIADDKKPIGRLIENYKPDAEAAIQTYLCRAANQKGVLIKDLGQQWLDKIDKICEDIKKNQKNKKTSQKVKKDQVGIVKSKQNIKGIDTSYSRMSKEKAEKRAAKDSRLERLIGGKGWSIVEKLFITDIPFARKFTGKILSFVHSLIGEHLFVTSALGTAGNGGNTTPHKVKENRYRTHHNAENPKLDLRTNGHANQLEKKLNSTGMFSWVYNEHNHLDVQIKPEVYMALEKGYKLEEIQKALKNSTIQRLIA